MHGASTFCFALGSLIAHVIAGIQKTAKLCRLILNICNLRRRPTVQSCKLTNRHSHCGVGASTGTITNEPTLVFRQFVHGLFRLIVNYSASVWNDWSSVRIGKSRGVANGRDVENIVCREPDTLFHMRFLFFKPIDIIGWSGSFRPRSNHKLYHSAKTRNQLDNIPSYAVALAGGSCFAADWAERPRATTRLNSVESCDGDGVAEPACQEESTAGATPTSWASRSRGVLDRAMAPLMSRISFFSEPLLTPENPLINSSLINSFSLGLSHSKKPTSASLSLQDAPKGRLPERLCVRLG